MATASRMVRKLRRARRERTLAYQALKAVAGQRDYLMNMMKEAEKAATKEVEAKSAVEIVKIEGDSLMDAPLIGEEMGLSQNLIVVPEE